jgi:hypothetical protein
VLRSTRVILKSTKQGINIKLSKYIANLEPINNAKAQCLLSPDYTLSSLQANLAGIIEHNATVTMFY